MWTTRDTAFRPGSWLAVAALALALCSSCVVAPRSVHTVGHVAAGAIVTAALVGNVAVMVVHDAHHHHFHCGHYRSWHEGRWIYYYGDHWEYYDEVDGRWYYYAE